MSVYTVFFLNSTLKFSLSLVSRAYYIGPPFESCLEIAFCLHSRKLPVRFVWLEQQYWPQKIFQRLQNQQYSLHLWKSIELALRFNSAVLNVNYVPLKNLTWNSMFYSCQALHSAIFLRRRGKTEVISDDAHVRFAMQDIFLIRRTWIWYVRWFH